MDPSIGDITRQFDPRIAALLGWVVVAIKVLIDWLKTVKELPVWAPPALAFIGALLVLTTLMVALGIPLTEQLLAQATLSALIATVLAIGQTALQARTKPTATPAVDAVAPSVDEVADEIEDRLKNQPARRRPRPALEDEAP